MNDVKDLETIVEQGIAICTDLSHLILSANYTRNSVLDMYTKLIDETKHLHLAGASGIDGEGLYFNNLGFDEITMFKHALNTKHAKVLEVWQGHLDNFEGFKLGIKQLSEVSHG
jgi:N-acetylneuraminate synthase